VGGMSEDEMERDIRVLFHSTRAMWREIVWLRILLVLTGFALLLVTLTVALK
jgi:hypothetical protein